MSDIEDHAFHSSIGDIVQIVDKSGATMIISLEVGNDWADISKPDAIAIAKALGVTGEDLK